MATHYPKLHYKIITELTVVTTVVLEQHLRTFASSPMQYRHSQS